MKTIQGLILRDRMSCHISNVITFVTLALPFMQYRKQWTCEVK